MDYVLQKAKLMARMKMSGGNKASVKIQVNVGEKSWQITCIFFVSR